MQHNNLELPQTWLIAIMAVMILNLNFRSNRNHNRKLIPAMVGGLLEVDPAF